MSVEQVATTMATSVRLRDRLIECPNRVWVEQHVLVDLDVERCLAGVEHPLAAHIGATF
jgi:hypothetical protein